MLSWRKYDADGTQLWILQLGSFLWDLSHGVSADSLGNVYISGVTDGGLGGVQMGRFNDVFVAKINDAFRIIPEPRGVTPGLLAVFYAIGLYRGQR